MAYEVVAEVASTAAVVVAKVSSTTDEDVAEDTSTVDEGRSHLWRSRPWLGASTANFADPPPEIITGKPKGEKKMSSIRGYGTTSDSSGSATKSASSRRWRDRDLATPIEPTASEGKGRERRPSATSLKHAKSFTSSLPGHTVSVTEPDSTLASSYRAEPRALPGRADDLGKDLPVEEDGGRTRTPGLSTSAEGREKRGGRRHSTANDCGSTAAKSLSRRSQDHNLPLSASESMSRARSPSTTSLKHRKSFISSQLGHTVSVTVPGSTLTSNDRAEPLRPRALPGRVVRDEGCREEMARASAEAVSALGVGDCAWVRRPDRGGRRGGWSYATVQRRAEEEMTFHIGAGRTKTVGVARWSDVVRLPRCAASPVAAAAGEASRGDMTAATTARGGTATGADAVGYAVGETGREEDMATTRDAAEFASGLKAGDAAFVRRSNGHWVWADVAKVVTVRTAAGADDARLTFRIDREGRTKAVRVSRCGGNVRGRRRPPR